MQVQVASRVRVRSVVVQQRTVFAAKPVVSCSSKICSVSRMRNTRPNVSWAGMPNGSSRNCSNQGLMSFAEAFDIRPSLRPADCAAKHESHPINQQMVVAAILARVFQIDEVCQKFKVSIRLHHCDSPSGSQKTAKRFCHLSKRRFTKKSKREEHNRRAIALCPEGSLNQCNV